jgi:hypothetical protein
MSLAGCEYCPSQPVGSSANPWFYVMIRQDKWLAGSVSTGTVLGGHDCWVGATTLGSIVPVDQTINGALSVRHSARGGCVCLSIVVRHLWWAQNYGHRVIGCLFDGDQPLAGLDDGPVQSL